MTAAVEAQAVPNVVFSHMGIFVVDLPRMAEFYTRALGFTITDRGKLGATDIVFLSRNPNDHHQIVLATGRPEVLPRNTLNPEAGPCVNQISFRIDSLTDLRIMLKRLQAENAKITYVGNHGIAWSVYASDPEGNRLEFFVDTDWYITQPFLVPLDLDQSDEEIARVTKDMCESSAGFEGYSDWRSEIGKKMARVSFIG